ncbi:zinc ABC transporter substrate-binding protein [Erysipelothrix sp. HDW6C]|uniref:metal ABC transporter substrate-binding protein n=1 Tax=Erysipelothrix sp. HDW6C TaxID=2714930 RepID=UPI001409B67D|nr:metal ABC transporter substrate-binding protein [Erysipelothrix sp. HDW6C]QIK70211.1 zinc ABC transporter substrate-binding protein [Erysipelothrix sp. HDW6C]
MKRFVTSIMAVTVLLLTLTGCVPKNKNVVVTSYPVEYLVRALAGDRVNIERLDVGANPQTSTVRDDYADVLANADVVFYINELQPYWELYRDELSDSKRSIELFDLAERSSLYTFNRYTTVEVDGSKHTLESPYYDTANFKSVDTYEKDPFLWMDPGAMTSMGRSIKDWLIEKYPDDAQQFEDRFAALEVELTNLQADYQKIRSNGKEYKIVTMTPSFGNWQRSFGIAVYPVSLSKYGVLPNEAMLNDIRTRIQQDGVKFIAYEEGMSEDQIKLYNQLKTELKLQEIKLSNLYTLSDKDVEEQFDYIIKMYQNLEALESMHR